MDASEEKRSRQRERTRRYRERLKAAGIKITKTPEQTRAAAERLARYRAEAKAEGRVLPCDDWWTRNPDKHRERVRRYRADNVEAMLEVGRRLQAARRSTPWGTINNRIWPILHRGVRLASHRRGKYVDALGYTWATLRAHLEAQFTAEMNWDNWGGVWELDHIRPIKTFQYVSLDDPLFKEAWALTNLQPLTCAENASKGSKTQDFT